MKNKRLRNDILIIAVSLLLCGAVLLIRFFTAQTGKYASVEIDGAVQALYPLDTDREYVIGDLHGDYNILVIKDGCAYISSASCPDKICVSHRKINTEGDRIVCLPNKLTVRIVQDKQS